VQLDAKRLLVVYDMNVSGGASPSIAGAIPDID